MKLTYDLNKEDVENIIQKYFQSELNYENSEVTCITKEANFKVEINDLSVEELNW